jgi:hypothetical protein
MVRCQCTLFHTASTERLVAMLPCSFRLSIREHRFELAAACQREKDAWMSSIRESLTQSPTWINEPTSSLEFDGKGELIPSALDDGPFEAINALPTIQSIPELASNSEDPEMMDVRETMSSKVEFPIRQDPELPSRRSSSASVKAIFSPSESDTIIIRRSSASARSRVDLGLQDVISQVCLTARLYASSREELFQAPKISRSGFVHSHSGLTMAGMAKNRLTRHESIRILRRKSLLDRPNFLSSKKAFSGQSLANRRRTMHLGITPLPEFDNRLFTRSSDPLSPLSATSSASVSTPDSASGSPIQRAAILGSPGGNSEATSPFKSSRSFVDNVKGFFGPRSSSPVSLSPATSNQSLDVEPHANKTLTPGSIKFWAKCSLHHRRTRSAPEVPDAPLPSSTPSKVVDAQKLNVGASILISRSSSAIADQRVPQHSFNYKPSRRKSLLSSSLRCSSGEMNFSTRGPAKNPSLLQRLTA